MRTIKRIKLTAIQYGVLCRTKPGESVKDIRTLRKLSHLGVIQLHEHTGEIVRHVWGMLVRAFYIDDAETFEVEGAGVFHAGYRSGSIFPYLVKL